jgi:hypothetical protein
MSEEDERFDMATFRRNFRLFRQNLRRAFNLPEKGVLSRLRERTLIGRREQRPSYETQREIYYDTVEEKKLDDGTILRLYRDEDGRIIYSEEVTENLPKAVAQMRVRSQQVRETPRTFLDEWRQRSIISSIRRAFQSASKAAELEVQEREKALAQKEESRIRALEEKIKRLEREKRMLEGKHW